MNKILIATALLCVTGLLHAKEAGAKSALSLPPDQKQQMMELALKSMWGNAVDRNGQKLQPLDEKQQATIPISDDMADEVIRVGMLDGIASWCTVEWKPHYLLYMQRVRRLYTDDVDIAYVSMLHGILQGIFARGRDNNGCDDETRKKSQETIEDDNRQLEKLLNIKASSLNP